jgi:hypothetical protein
MLRAVLAGLLLFLAACEEPANVSASLTDPGAIPADADLAGAWTWVARGARDDRADLSSAMLVVRPDAGTLRVTGSIVMLSVRDDATAPVDMLQALLDWEAVPTRIDGVTYLSLRQTGGGDGVRREPDGRLVLERDGKLAPHPDRGWWIARIERVGPDSLRIRLLGESVLKARGVPYSEVDCGEGCRMPVHALDRAALYALIRDLGPEAFKSPAGLFQRVTLPLPELLER